MSADLATESTKSFKILIGKVLTVQFFIDFAILYTAFSLAYFLRSHTPLQNLGIYYPEVTYSSYQGRIIFYSFLFQYLLFQFRTYQRFNILKIHRLVIALIKTQFYWAILLLAVETLLQLNILISRLYLLISLVLVPSIFLIWRILLSRYLVNHSRIQQLLRENIVIIGWSEQASKFAQALVKDELSLFHIVGWVKTETSLDPLILPNNVKCLGNYQNLESIMADQKVDTLLLADLDFSEEKRIRLSNFCIKNMVDFKISPTYSELLTKGMVVDLMNNLPVIDVTTLPLDKFGNRLTKRVLDIVGSLIGLVISLPLILIFGSIVYLESPGPVFYRQKRIGLNGKIIEIIKIRSMKLDAEKNGAKWATENDSRCLKIGRFIRKFNIDEIPQFWNVLKGEMSLVGPRPERPEFTTNFQDDIPHYNARNNALPGMSGLAQIKGLRGNTDLKKRLQQDIYYLENWSIWLDLYIILKTFTTVENAH